jgi:4-hydroxy-3-polyprenylbenzoate decarboxylase
MPAFYAKPQGVDEIIDQCVGRALDLVGLDWGRVRRWGRDLAAIDKVSD